MATRRSLFSLAVAWLTMPFLNKTVFAETAAENWRPIEGAPKDQIILGCKRFPYPAHPIPIYWALGSDDYDSLTRKALNLRHWNAGWRCTILDAREEVKDLAYWMPLPEPPAETAKKLAWIEAHTTRDLVTAP